MLVAEFTLPSPEERAARRRELEAQLEHASAGGQPSQVADEAKEEDVVDPDESLPSAPDLDALSGDE